MFYWLDAQLVVTPLTLAYFISLMHISFYLSLCMCEYMLSLCNVLQRNKSMVQGDFDPLPTVGRSTIPKAVANSTDHHSVAHDAALQSMVMLKHAGNSIT